MLLCVFRVFLVLDCGWGFVVFSVLVLFYWDVGGCAWAVGVSL